MGLLGRPARAVTRALLSAQVGGLTGFLAQRVLGQYDMPLLDSTGAAAPADGRARTWAPRPSAWRPTGSELLHWVTLHELTHAVQFGSVPWLRLHLASLVREVVDTLEVKIDTLEGRCGCRAPSDLRDVGRRRSAAASS